MDDITDQILDAVNGNNADAAENQEKAREDAATAKAKQAEIRRGLLKSRRSKATELLLHRMAWVVLLALALAYFATTRQVTPKFIYCTASALIAWTSYCIGFWAAAMQIWRS